MSGLTDTAKAIADTLRHQLPENVTVQHFDPGGHGFDTPLVAVALPSLTPPAYDEGNSQLGTFDWEAVWPVTLYVALEDPETDQDAARELTDCVIQAIHRDPTCGGRVEDASVTKVDSGFNADNDARRLIVVEFDVTTYTPRPV